jgi:hypothetical protein
MRLRTLVGAYAGQEHEYGAVAGLAALRSGTAERLDRVTAQPSTALAPPVAPEAPRKPVRAKTR